MKAKLSTHALDIYHGRPAANLQVNLYRLADDMRPVFLKKTVTNSDGRTDVPLLGPEEMKPGIYEIVFEVGSYFKALATDLPEPPFLGDVPIRFTISDAAQSYHVPLLFSPWAYSTYRGS
jgi:5-hydroxyisourate hydrolase